MKEQPARFETIEQASLGGLCAEDISALRIFLRHTFSSTGRSRDCVTLAAEREDIATALGYFSKNFDPRALLLSNDHGLDIGVIYSAKHDSLWIVGQDRLPGYNEVIMRRTNSGYIFTLVDGCLHFPLELITAKGRPFVVRFPKNEEG